MASAEGGDKYRSFLHSDGEKNTVWRHGAPVAPPNYDLVNKLFEEERTKEWPEGSLEEKVQHLLKSWEMEMVHKVRPGDQKSVHPKNYSASTNRLKPLTREEVIAISGYNAFLATTLSPKHRIYNSGKETDDSGMLMFLTAFPRGFAIEVLDVYNGPPRVAFKFRHWGYMEGPFKGHPPHGQRVEFFGVCVFHISSTVDEDTWVEKAEYFYECGNFLVSFFSTPASAAVASALGCPLMRVGLNNIKVTDFVNVTIQSLMRIAPLRNFFLIPENYQHSKSPLVHRFGELTRKIWRPRQVELRRDCPYLDTVNRQL
ncbi:pathogen-related protein-like [Triticum aestivum]|uniref:pathogen-related protein-like n=1 Tax=Triticum aestivum TaxID=4565 RepID=UPI001D01191B|nr:pathogen-related protein-like [Triticum aestivum]